MTPLLETTRLVIQPLTLDDGAFVLDVLNEPLFLRFVGDRGVRTLDDARRYLAEGPLASYAAHGFGMWRVSDRATGAPLGLCGLVKRPDLPGPDLGYAFLAQHEGQGYAREAASAVVTYSRTTLHLPQLLAIVHPGHARSIRLLVETGFILRSKIRRAGESEEILLYALG
jgi:[ribosomal protein S5]-alanine N-acetyltransferase